MTILARIIFCAILLPLSWFTGGYTVVKLWHWFIVSTFNLPELSIITAIGIKQFINYLIFKVDNTKVEYKDNYGLETALITNIMISLISLLIGYLLTLMM